MLTDLYFFLLLSLYCFRRNDGLMTYFMCTRPADVPYRPLNNFTGIQDWRVTRLFDSGTPAKPHMMVSMMNQINAQEDCLLQGELMAMIRVMHGRIPLNFFREHLIFPVS